VVIPQTRYATTFDGIHVAYQVVGEGSVDLVFVMGWTSNIEAMWEEPALARFLSRLASFSRLILFDKRGVGLSDRVPEAHLPSLETRMDDVRAVMDAVGSERAVIFGVSEGGPMAMLFAATYPERTIALVLFGTDSDFTGRYTKASLDEIHRAWGTEEYAREALRTWAAPSCAGDERLVGWLASYMRRAASPGAAIALERMNSQIDVTPALSTIHVPTLVLARSGDLDFNVDDGRRVAEAIRGARFVELAGDDHFFWVGDQESSLGEIERFVAEFRDQEAELERFLATVLFTDVVGSTERASELGDRRWKVLLETHHARVRGQLARYRGREIGTTGDGFLATFDGPARAIRCATAITQSVRDLGVEVRAGLHAGECEQIGEEIGGIAVHIGARVAAHAGASEVWVSQTVKDLVAGSGLAFDDRGEHELKGVSDRWRLYRVAGRGIGS
jgi:pimeloyl-ACP methyl ester carboxylesterase